MKVLVLGANGKVGTKVVQELLGSGHSVRGFIHSTSDLSTHPKLELFEGDVYQEDDINAAIEGCDAVISALGSWGTKRKDILSEAMKRLVPAMEAAGVRRIVSLTGGAALDPTDSPSILDKVVRRLSMLVASKILADGEIHIRMLRDSTLDWTVLRSPVMLENGHRGFILSTSPPFPTATINRRDVAVALKDLLETHSHLQESPFIKRA